MNKKSGSATSIQIVVGFTVHRESDCYSVMITLWRKLQYAERRGSTCNGEK